MYFFLNQTGICSTHLKFLMTKPYTVPFEMDSIPCLDDKFQSLE